MRNIPVDITNLTTLVGGAIQPATNQDGTQKRDGGGRPLFTVPVVIVADSGNAETINVRLPGPVPQVAQLTPVRFVKLVARPWSMEGRSGVSYLADSFQPVAAKQ